MSSNSINSWPNQDCNYQESFPLFEIHVPPQYQSAWHEQQKQQQPQDQEPEYNPDIHLQLTAPEYRYLLDFTKTQQTPTAEFQAAPDKTLTANSSLALTAPFNVLSAEGVRVVRDIVARNMKYVQTHSERTPRYIRGMAYTSKFIRDLNECPKLRAYLSNLAGLALYPHTILTNYSQINLGQIGQDRPVDAWHVDSVPFVLVIILSDQTDSQGGALQMILRRGREEATQLLQEHHGEPLSSDMVTVSYLGAGSGMFMQGSQIMHRVTPVIRAREPRMSMVLSFMSSNAFVDDRTVYDTYIVDEKEAMFEFSRMKAWRVMQQLRDFVYHHPYTDNAQIVEPHLIRMSQELQRTADLISGKVSDKIGFFDPKKQQQQQQQQQEVSETSEKENQ